MKNLNELKKMSVDELIGYCYEEFGIEDVDLPELEINNNQIIDDGIGNRAKMIARIAEIDDNLYQEMSWSGNPDPCDWEEVVFDIDTDLIDIVIERLNFYHKADYEAFEKYIEHKPTKRLAEALDLI